MAGQLQEAIRDASDPGVVMRRVVDQALVLIAAADGAVVELAADGYLTYVCAAGSLAGHVGTRLRASESLSGLAVSCGETLYCEDAAADGRVDREACLRVGAVSMVCVPLRRGAEVIGVLKVTSGRACAFTQAQVEVLAALAGFISTAVGAVSDISQSASSLLARRSAAPVSVAATRTAGGQADASAGGELIGTFVANVLRPGVATGLAARQRVEAVLAGGSLKLVGQPIVDLSDGKLVGVEALARFPGQPQQPPDVWFSQAHDAGLGVALELEAFQLALTLLEQIPSGAYLAINLSPHSLAAGELPRLLGQGGCERVVIELTEHTRIDDYPRCREHVRRIREHGARLAIDDTGAGFASLSHIVNLAPDLIKLDRQFTTGIDLDPVRRALAQALVSFAQDTGAQVIAEGIETTDELDTVRELGIPYGQGYLIGRPAPPAAIRKRYSQIAQALTTRIS